MQQLLRRPADLDMQVDSVQQRARYLAAVNRYPVRAAAAIAGEVAEEATGAWIHGGDELKPGRKVRLPARTRNRNRSSLEWFAQDLKHIAVELWQFVQK